QEQLFPFRDEISPEGEIVVELIPKPDVRAEEIADTRKLEDVRPLLGLAVDLFFEVAAREKHRHPEHSAQQQTRFLRDRDLVLEPTVELEQLAELVSFRLELRAIIDVLTVALRL